MTGIKVIILVLVATFLLKATMAQKKPNLQASADWSLHNRTATPILEKKGIRLSAAPNDGLMILQNTDFSEGVVELDIKGSHLVQQSFVGLAFHIQDTHTFDAVYFRPFNFKSDEAIRRSHSVQYISMPDHDWEKLRNTYPGKYENNVNPAPNPDEWFHAKIVIKGQQVTVYVNNSQQLSLQVDKISSSTHGRLGLWVGNNSPGDFANLSIKSIN